MYYVMPESFIKDPQQMNAYSYVSNNPVKNTDPNGKCIEDACVLEAVILLSIYLYGVYSSYQDAKQTSNDPNSTKLDKAESYGMLAFSLSPIGGERKGTLTLVDDIAKKFKNLSPQVLGKAGEMVAGVYGKVKEVIYINGRVRIPDEINRITGEVIEVKNVSYQALTTQLKDSMQYAKDQGYKFVLYVRENTELSKNLKALVDNGSIILKKMSNSDLLKAGKKLIDK